MQFMDVSNYSANISEYPISFTDISALESYLQSVITSSNNYSTDLYRYKNLDLVSIDVNIFSSCRNPEYNLYHDLTPHLKRCHIFRDMKRFYCNNDILNMYVGRTGLWSRTCSVGRFHYNNHDIFLNVTPQQADIIRGLGIDFYGGYHGSYIWLNSKDLNQIKLCVENIIEPAWNVNEFEAIENRWWYQN